MAGGLYTDGERRAVALENLDDAGMKQALAQWYKSVERLPGATPQHAFRWILNDLRVSTVSSGAGNVAELEEVAQASTIEAF